MRLSTYVVAAVVLGASTAGFAMAGGTPRRYYSVSEPVVAKPVPSHRAHSSKKAVKKPAKKTDRFKDQVDSMRDSDFAVLALDSSKIRAEREEVAALREYDRHYESSDLIIQDPLVRACDDYDVAMRWNDLYLSAKVTHAEKLVGIAGSQSVRRRAAMHALNSAIDAFEARDSNELYCSDNYGQPLPPLPWSELLRSEKRWLFSFDPIDLRAVRPGLDKTVLERIIERAEESEKATSGKRKS